MHAGSSATAAPRFPAGADPLQMKRDAGFSFSACPSSTVAEVANLVVYVCSHQASATTGAALRVDGGVVDTIA